MAYNEIHLMNGVDRGPNPPSAVGSTRRMEAVGNAKRAPRAERAADAIGRRIVSGDLTPGSTLPSLDDLAKEMSVSRLSMREAIKLLTGKGLVSSTPRRGTVVRPRSQWSRLDADVLDWQVSETPTVDFVRSLFEIRQMIEPEAAALAARRADEKGRTAIEAAFLAMAAADPNAQVSIEADIELHKAILGATRNDFVAAFAPAIEASLRVTFRVQRDAWPDRDNFVPSHGAVVTAILERDSDGAAAAMRKLLTRSESDAMDGIHLRETKERQKASA
jgi:DNA-binding FadR family transcriptional regulator